MLLIAKILGVTVLICSYLIAYHLGGLNMCDKIEKELKELYKKWQEKR